MAKKGRYQIPFDPAGNQLHYPELHTWTDGKPDRIEWRDNARFTAVLKYQGQARGRSAAYFIFADPDGHEVTFFMKDFEALVPHLNKGVVIGTFEFTKRGQNYGCQLVEP
ncbi:hypothetical protein [Bradyrhizobium sp. SZCCHNS3053]|uniref:hypothetical protein n=1 Tax=Bradyrhizobium sp. SZCCHNS3053 TaxID=3057322 RepID=UPI002916F569|nr:hypothetical protein [Bradyrhizobium sp. SZCCHNS3053]